MAKLTDEEIEAQLEDGDPAYFGYKEEIFKLLPVRDIANDCWWVGIERETGNGSCDDWTDFGFPTYPTRWEALAAAKRYAAAEYDQWERQGFP
jgi:hypothetical protein